MVIALNRGFPFLVLKVLRGLIRWLTATVKRSHLWRRMPVTQPLWPRVLEFQ